MILFLQCTDLIESEKCVDKSVALSGPSKSSTLSLSSVIEILFQQISHV